MIPAVTVASYEKAFQEWAAEQPTITGCTLCPWTYEGSAVEGQAASREHRLAHAAEFERRAEEREAERRRVLEEARRAKLEESARRRRARLERLEEARSRPGPRGRSAISEEQLLEARRLNVEGRTLSLLAEEHFSEWGYVSAGSALASLSRIFKQRGWEVARAPRREYPPGPAQVTLLRGARQGLVLWLWEVGCSPGQIATYAWEAWGFGSANSCKTQITKLLRREAVWVHRRDGVSTELADVARSEAVGLIEALR